MSLVAATLFRHPAPNFSGRVFTNNSDRRRHEMSAAQEETAARNKQTREANIELIFNAVVDGFRLIESIVDHTGLSISTVKKGLDSLEDAKRISRDKRERKHRFTMKEKL